MLTPHRRFIFLRFDGQIAKVENTSTFREIIVRTSENQFVPIQNSGMGDMSYCAVKRMGISRMSYDVPRDNFEISMRLTARFGMA